MFTHVNDMVRYCDTDDTNRLNCWSPSTSVNTTCVPPNTSPPLVTPRATGGRPSRNSFSNLPFFFLFDATMVWLSGAWKSTIGPGEPKSDEATLVISSLRSSTCRPYSPLK